MPKKGQQSSLKPSLKGVVVALAGEFVVGGNSYKESQVAGWVRLRDGEFTNVVDASVTHLLCSKEDFDAKTPTVKRILQLNKDKKSTKTKVSGKPCFILTPDWLEDTCLATRRLKEEDYRLDKKAKEENKQSKEACRPGGFHVYIDGTTHFEHRVTVTRTVNNDTQRYEMMVLESNSSRPHLYLFRAKYLRRKGDSKPAYHQPSPVFGTLQHALKEFQFFFKNKTGVEWDHRLDNAWLAGKFRYEPPTGGKPVGPLPPGLASSSGISPVPVREAEHRQVADSLPAQSPSAQAKVAIPMSHGAHETDAGVDRVTMDSDRGDTRMSPVSTTSITTANLHHVQPRQTQTADVDISKEDILQLVLLWKKNKQAKEQNTAARSPGMELS